MKRTIQRSIERKKAAPLHKDNKLACAISLQQQWRFEEAKVQYLALIQETPNDADALHNLGVLFSVQLLEPVQALPYFEAALNLQPTKLQFWYSYLDALIKAGTLDVAEHVLQLASNYGLNERQITSFSREISLARTTIEDLVNAALADAAALPVPQTVTAPVSSAQQPSMVELQQLLSIFNQKKYGPTVKAIQELLQRFPQAGVLWTLLAETEKRRGFLDKALQARHQAASLEPTNAATQMAWADALLALNQRDEATAVLQAILRMEPSYVPALGQMGQIYQQQGLVKQALHSYGWALRGGGANPVLLERFGAMLRALGNQDGALVCFKLAVESSPHSPELLDVYGETLFNQSRLAAAENAFRSALKTDPGYTPALRHLCYLLEFHGRFSEAETGLLRCNQIEKGSAEALFEVGRNLSQQKRDSEAVDWLRRAVKAKPDFVAAHIALSAALSKTESPAVVLDEIKASIRLQPNVPALHTNLGITCMQLSRTDEAIACFRQALNVDPNFDYARSCLLFALSHSTKITPQELFREHRIYGEKIESRLKGKEYTSYSNTKIPDRPLKVGFVSADFRNHAVAQFVIPFFKALARHGDIVSYAYVNHGARDESTAEIEQSIHVWQQVVKWSDDQLAEKIREDGIDILVDMSGHTEGHRLPVFAKHPAPVQMSWLGYPGTTGLKAMDYRLVSQSVLRNDHGELQKQFVENFAIIPPGFIFKKIENLPETSAPCLSNGYITFGSFNRLNKINYSVIQIWCSILRLLPKSRLLMGGMPSNGAPKELIDWFASEGIDSDRVDFYPRTTLSDYFKLHDQVDICLDTFPYTGGTTTNHALQLGVPTLTMAGTKYAERQSLNMLYRLELGEACVAKDAEDIKRLAAAWAAHPESINKVRKVLRKKLHESHGYLQEMIVQGVAYSFRQMWKTWCAEEKPKQFLVDYEDIGFEKLSFSYEEDVAKIAGFKLK